MPEQMTLPENTRQLAELLAERIGLVGPGQVKLMFDEDGRCCDAYKIKSERARVSLLEATPVFPPCTCLANTTIVRGRCIVCGRLKSPPVSASIE